MDYYIYLKCTGEYVQETDDDLIWGRCEDITYAFNDNDYDRVNKIAMFICSDKNLSRDDIMIIGEELVIETTEYPVGVLYPLYYIGNDLSNNLDELHQVIEKQQLNELSECAFSELYYRIDTVQELLDWCNNNGYKWNELERHFNGLKLFRGQNDRRVR